MTDSHDNQNSHPPALRDFDMTTRFLSVLTGNSDEAVTFQIFDDKKLDNTLARWMHRKRSKDTFKNLAAVQSKGAGVYIMVNRGNCTGRKAENVVEVRALFIDLDGSPWEPAADMLKPHIRVESSPGRFHLYWLVSDCDLDQFKPIQQAIAKQFAGDKSCVDLCRVLRLPGFLHQKTEPVLTKLIEANDFPKYTTQQVIEGLQLNMADVALDTAAKQSKPSTAASTLAYEYIDTSTGDVLNLTTWAAQNPAFDLVAAVDPQYYRGAPKEGKQHITCPFEDQHTDQLPDTATFIVNASPPEYPSFTIHCCHSHCADRDRLDYILAMLEKGWMSVDQIQFTAPDTIEIRRPIYVTYKTNEILAAPEWSTLRADERRIAQDIMVMCWAEIDGMIADDNWAIARRLDIPETEWMSYRQTLNRTGWLVEFNGRLTNAITKREFDNAQTAYMISVINGGIGGKKAAENRRKKQQ